MPFIEELFYTVTVYSIGLGNIQDIEQCLL